MVQVMDTRFATHRDLTFRCVMLAAVGKLRTLCHSIIRAGLVHLPEFDKFLGRALHTTTQVANPSGRFMIPMQCVEFCVQLVRQLVVMDPVVPIAELKQTLAQLHMLMQVARERSAVVRPGQVFDP